MIIRDNVLSESGLEDLKDNIINNIPVNIMGVRKIGYNV